MTKVADWLRVMLLWRCQRRSGQERCCFLVIFRWVRRWGWIVWKYFLIWYRGGGRLDAWFVCGEGRRCDPWLRLRWWLGKRGVTGLDVQLEEGVDVEGGWDVADEEGSAVSVMSVDWVGRVVFYLIEIVVYHMSNIIGNCYSNASRIRNCNDFGWRFIAKWLRDDGL